MIATQSTIPTRPILDYWLRHNHYPALPVALVPVCEQAIDAAQSQDFERLIELPDGLKVNEMTAVTAREVIRGCHLDAFLTPEDTEPETPEDFEVFVLVGRY